MELKTPIMKDSKLIWIFNKLNLRDIRGYSKNANIPSKWTNKIIFECWEVLLWSIVNRAKTNLKSQNLIIISTIYSIILEPPEKNSQTKIHRNSQNPIILNQAKIIVNQHLVGQSDILNLPSDHRNISRWVQISNNSKK